MKQLTRYDHFCIWLSSTIAGIFWGLAIAGEKNAWWIAAIATLISIFWLEGKFPESGNVKQVLRSQKNSRIRKP